MARAYTLNHLISERDRLHFYSFILAKTSHNARAQTKYSISLIGSKLNFAIEESNRIVTRYNRIVTRYNRIVTRYNRIVTRCNRIVTRYNAIVSRSI